MGSGEGIINEILGSPVLRETIERCIRESQPFNERNSLNPCDGQSVQVQQTASTSTSNINTPRVNSNMRDELRRLFPTISSRNSTEISVRPVRHKKAKYIKKKNFSCNVFLLKSSLEKRTLLGKKKAKAFEEGYAISAVEFERQWSFEEVKNKLKTCFSSLLEDVDFEIMIPVGGYLVRPTLNENQVLDGFHLYKLFYGKSIYLRPSETSSIKLSDAICESNNLHYTDVFEEPSVCSIANIDESSSIVVEEAPTNDDDFKEIFEEITSIADILAKLRHQINEDSSTCFNVYREDVFGCCLRALNRKSFSATNRLSVCFVDSEDNSEGAIDAGGPTREMFRLLMCSIKNSHIFVGPENTKRIVFNRDALEKNEYLYVGKLIVLSIIHAGLSPAFFCDLLFHQIIGSDCSSLIPSLDDIFDDNIKIEIEAAMRCENLMELRTVVIEGTYIRLAGWQMINSFEKKEDMINDVVKFYAIEINEKCIDQLIDGLKIMNFHKYLKKFPEYFVEVFCKANTQILDVNKFETLFTINFSETGSNKRRVENKIVAFWKDYLIECFENNDEECCTLEEILTFCTGSDSIPLTGFSTPIYLNFLHDDYSPFPKGNTCGLILHLPIIHSNYSEFKSKVTFGIKNGMVFGFV